MNNILLDTLVSDPTIPTPALIINLDTIAQTYNRFCDLMPQATVFYAMKANAHPQVLRVIADCGGGLEIASSPELDLALDAGVPADRIICSNPIKSPEFIRRMQDMGVYAMVVDSTYEVEKVAYYAPGSRVYVRLAVDNTGSVLPLAGKFGVDSNQALELFDMAADMGLQPIGLSFHVGSQCLSPNNWVNAIRACGQIWEAAIQRGHQFHFLNLGGGFPAGHYHTPTIPTLETIASLINHAIANYMPETPAIIALEPGRGMVGEAGRLVASVMGKAHRGQHTWLYLDAGVFNGLMETFEGFPPVVSLADGQLNVNHSHHYTLAGPSCDSCDVIAQDITLPAVNIGDRLAFYDAGAYTNEYASNFNGFNIPQMIFVSEDQNTVMVTDDVVMVVA